MNNVDKNGWLTRDPETYQVKLAETLDCESKKVKVISLDFEEDLRPQDWTLGTTPTRCQCYMFSLWFLVHIAHKSFGITSIDQWNIDPPSCSQFGKYIGSFEGASESHEKERKFLNCNELRLTMFGVPPLWTSQEFAYSSGIPHQHSLLLPM